MNNEYISKIPITQVINYSINVPFHRNCTISEVTLTTNDDLNPIIGEGLATALRPVPGYGAIYRVTGDGTAIPTFGSTFKKSGGSADYDETLGVLNLIVFLFDGVDYWYSITQAA